MLKKQYDTMMWETWLSRLDLPALAVADQINLFGKISVGNTSVSQLAEALALGTKDIDALTTFLASMGFLSKTENEVALTKHSIEYLLPSSAGYWGPALLRAKNSQEYNRLLEALQKNNASQLSINGKTVTSLWEEGDISYEEAKQFTSIMHCTIYSAAKITIASGMFDNTKALLDVGAGSGCFISLFVKKYLDVTAGIYELPAVCRVTQEYLNIAKCLDRVKLFQGNFFKDDLPKGFDGILFSNIFHDWPVEIAKFLARKAYEVLPAGGKIFIHEMLLNDQRNGPKIPAAFNLLMYINHGSQQFTQNELFSILEEVGFTECYVENAHPLFSMVIGKKPNTDH